MAADAQACRRRHALDLVAAVENDRTRADETDAAYHLGADTGRIGILSQHRHHVLSHQHGAGRTHRRGYGYETPLPLMFSPLITDDSTAKHCQHDAQRQ